MIKSLNYQNGFLKVLFSHNYIKNNLKSIETESTFKKEKSISHISEEAIDQLISRGYCLCGQKIEKGEDAYRHLIESKENLGFGRANNLGVSVASGQNILFLNPDTVLINNAVKILVDYTNNHPSVGACCGNLYDGDMRPTLSFKRIFPGILDELNNLSQSEKEAFIKQNDINIRQSIGEAVPTIIFKSPAANSLEINDITLFFRLFATFITT